jgi:glycosyltransferase involved in cell wall biosynthesis
MRIALVHDWLNGMRGGEKVLSVLCELFPTAPIYTLLLEPEKVSPSIVLGRQVHTSWIQRSRLLRQNYRYLLPLLPATIERFDLSSYDLVISSSHCVAKGVRTGPKTLHLCYAHTPMRYVWGFEEEYFGNAAKRLLLEPLLSGLRHWDVRTSKDVDYFIANSHFVSERIRRAYDRESHVIHPPVDTKTFVPSRHQGDYFLMATALVPYKKVDLAIETFRGRKESLVIIGSGPLAKRLRRKSPANVHFLGWTPRETLLKYYQGCRALIFPQTEDFGIVPLEVQACGRPVIAYGAGGALETVIGHPQGYVPKGARLRGGPTGIFFARQTAESLAEALETFIKLEKTFDPNAIRDIALAFDTERCRKELRDFILSKIPHVKENILTHV